MCQGCVDLLEWQYRATELILENLSEQMRREPDPSAIVPECLAGTGNPTAT